MTQNRTFLGHFALPNFGRPFMQNYYTGRSIAGGLMQLASKGLANDTKCASQFRYQSSRKACSLLSI